MCESTIKIMEHVTVQLSTSELVWCWFAALTYRMFMFLHRFSLSENRLSYCKAEFNQELKFQIMFEKLYSCLQFGMKSRLHFKFDENWLRCL